MKRVMYIRPPLTSTTGIRNYSNIVLEIMARHYSREFQFIDLTAEDAFFNNIYRSLSKHHLRAYLQWMKEQGAFDGLHAIIAEIGINEFVEFFTLRELKRICPQIPSFVTLHDPPETVKNLNPAFSRLERYKVVRGLRRYYNKAFGIRVERDFFRQGHNFIVLSCKGKRLLEERLKVMESSSSEIHHLPLVNFFEGPMAAPNESHPTSGQLTLGYFGFVNPHKGLDILVQAVEGLPPENKVMALIAGGAKPGSDQRYLDNLKRYVEQKSLQNYFQFTGYLTDEQIPAFLQGLDVMVLPYKKTDSGSASGPLMWARSLGLPVVASDTRAFPENIEHGNDGLLFEADNISSLRKCLKSICDDHNLLARLRQGAIHRRDECSHARTAGRIAEILRKRSS